MDKTPVETKKHLKTEEENVFSFNYELETDGRYRIDDYDQMNAFASFLPGVGGVDGVPLWCMYVNRAQAVTSFGIANKDNAILEFFPATSAYQSIGTQGFRSFCKIDGQYYEPFQNNQQADKFKYQRSMWIDLDRIFLRETNDTLGLQFDVEYFSPVNKPLGSLVRKFTISNISKETKKIEGLDGLPIILPAGLTDLGIKTMRRISEAYASVRLVGGMVPFFAAKVLAHDEAEVREIEHGNFYAAFVTKSEKLVPIEPIIDPDVIFGHGNDLVTPREFIKNDSINREKQVWENRLSCAMTPFETTLEPQGSVEIITISGSSPTGKAVIDFLADFRSIEDIHNAADQSSELMNSLTAPAMNISQIPELDGYVRQNYLDNILRGGIPMMLPSKSGPTLMHLYSRRHGDIERDYNYFVISPQPLSSGVGNYRDICQNRRNDVWFYPDLWDQEIRMFVGLIHADGYNPLAIEGYRWVLPKETNPADLCPKCGDQAKNEFCENMKKEFNPGQLLLWVDKNNVKVPDRFAWINGILEKCDRILCADGHEGGYWIDHWSYLIDLLESFTGIFPDHISQVLTGSADIQWFAEKAHVVPRKDKYMIKPKGLLQLNAILDDPEACTDLPRVTIFGKLCALLAVKAVSFDYECRGIEMEAGRPGWNDSLNGLPAMFGSSVNQSAEIVRLASWLLKHLPEVPDTKFPVVVADFIDKVIEDMGNSKYCWDRASTIREQYRDRIYHNSSTKTRMVSGKTLKSLLKGIEKRAKSAVKKCIDSDTGLMHTYYKSMPVMRKGVSHEELMVSSERKSLLKDIRKFTQKPLPLFLEGQVHLLRLVDMDKAKDIYKAVRDSSLFDDKLRMYKLNESLEACSPDIGRARTFSRGWFENESIWLHMSYKYLLELLRSGAHEEFFADARTMLVPFMDPGLYGRSILENSSFIASSACPDANARGRGFVARLSGSTAEFIHIWLLMTVGTKPFFLKRGKLFFELSPILPGKWFTEEAKYTTRDNQPIVIPMKAFACTLLGKTLLVYHNKSGRDTFGTGAVKPVKYLLDEKTEIQGSQLGPEIAEKIRRRQYKRIDVWLE